MTDAEFDQVIAVHLKGSYACTKAVWPIFRKQKYGRIINTASAAGLYGAHFSEATASEFGRLTDSGDLYRQFWSGKLQCCQDGPHRVHEDPREGRGEI